MQPFEGLKCEVELSVDDISESFCDTIDGSLNVGTNVQPGRAKGNM